MPQSTVTFYFLGANSENGFYSLYDQFCCGPNDTLHIIKGGPGTGKSTFMRRIGKAAEEQGLDVEYILCSGDPSSLDGVYLPRLHQGWADGTAPHILEPKLFGVTADYIDLGRFCNGSLLQQCGDLITELNKRYKSHYSTAYRYLHAAGALSHNPFDRLRYEDEQRLRKRARSKITRELNKSNTPGKVTKRFLTAISCQGITVLDNTLNTLCDRLCVLESDYALEDIFFCEIIDEIQKQGAACIICPNPLTPNLTDAVILPKEKIGFISSRIHFSFCGVKRTIHLDAYHQYGDQKLLKQEARLRESLLDMACSYLMQAKQLHDELEACYRPALDTQKLSEYTEQVIQGLFS